jgi:CRP/FNR family transcriptional regulator/CRP/FNR family cyclic AMP-dependent transcriptional regulator
MQVQLVPLPEKQPPERGALIRKLAKVPLFAALGERELATVADAGRMVTFDKGKVILKQGEPAISFLLVLEGRVEVRRKGKKIASTGPEGFFGEMSLFDDRPRSADVVATEPTTCFGMTSWSFMTELKANPTMAMAVIKELVRRIRALEEPPSD